MIGDKIKTLRMKKHITQEELANLLYVTPQAISKWEKGISVPDTAILIPLSDIFKVSVDFLLRDETNDEKVINIVKNALRFDYTIDDDGLFKWVSGVVKNNSEHDIESIYYKIEFIDENGSVIDSYCHYIFCVSAKGEKPFRESSDTKKHVKGIRTTILKISLDKK